MIVDFKHAIDWGFTLVDGTIVTVLVPWLAGRALEYFHISKQSVLGQRILTAAENGASAALLKGQALADVHAGVEITDAHVAATMQYVNDTVPDALTALHVDDHHLEAIVTAQLAKAATPPPPPVIVVSPQATMEPIAYPPDPKP